MFFRRHFPDVHRSFILLPQIEFEVEVGIPCSTSKSVQQSVECKGIHGTSETTARPWSEWVELLQMLGKKGYFDEASSSSKDSNRIRTACLNFARRLRSDIIVRHMSREDIHVIAKYGCPSVDRKVVNSGKRLRAYVGTEEGDVCSMCKIRGSCDRAYAKASLFGKSITVDLMRILLTYGIDTMVGSPERKLCLNSAVEQSIRRLMTQITSFGNKGVDLSFAKSTVQPSPKNLESRQCKGLFQERLKPIMRDLERPMEMKTGDWVCGKCNFQNFAKQTTCFQCNEKPLERHINPGEWECESCNFVNFQRNMACLRCNWKRPKAFS